MLLNLSTSLSILKKILKGVLNIIPFFYVLFILFFNGIEHFKLWAFVLVMLALSRFVIFPNAFLPKKIIKGQVILGCSIISLVCMFAPSFFEFLMPILISLLMSYAFLYSVISPPSLIESFMTLQIKNIEDHHKIYAKKLSLVWGIFLIINALASYASSLISREVWAFYNGILSYGLMAFLFLGEFFYRKVIKKC